MMDQEEILLQSKMRGWWRLIIVLGALAHVGDIFAVTTASSDIFDVFLSGGGFIRFLC